MKIYLSLQSYNQRLYKLINSYKLQHNSNSAISLIVNDNALELYDREHPIQKSIIIDFTSKINHCRYFNKNKKKEMLSKAIGIKKSYFPFVVDATAGLGNDAFLLAFLGCRVCMIERHPVIAALLQDGLYRGRQDKKIGHWLKKRLYLIFHDSCNVLTNFKPDVIYLDPMYPINTKTALPKKNMQIFRKLIKHDNNFEQLLIISRRVAKNRVVVKRPHYAKCFLENQINFTISGKTHRFDVYNPV
jgi:16S rRNA (guanine1516-N2)-methyltransferase